MKTNRTTQRILEFLNAHDLGVVSTIHVDGKSPESAVVGFGNTDGLELIFGTDIGTRKYRNLQANPNVSFVIGWSSETGTLQYEGSARELTDNELDNYAHLLLKKNDSHREYIGLPSQRYFLITPTWIRYYDNGSRDADVFEWNA